MNVFIEFSIYLLLFGGLYWFALRDLTEYKYLRIYILSALSLSTFIPFLPKSPMLPEAIPSIQLPMIEVGLNEINTASFYASRSIHWMQFLVLIYACITFILMSRLVWSIYKINNLKTTAELTKKEGNIFIFRSESIRSAYSFFNAIFIPNTLDFSSREGSLTINHEKIHIELKHSYERILLELFRVFFWWHPIVHIFKTELINIHEYEVDDKITTQNNKKDYSKFLVGCAPSQNFQLVNTISSNLKKRIIMLYREKKSISKLSKITALSLVTILSLSFHSCQKDQNVLKAQADLAKEKDNHTESYTITNSDTIIVFNPDTKQEEIKVVSSDMQVFKQADQMPEFPGCENLSGDERSQCSQKKLLTYIYSNVKYPKEAFDKKLDGLVISKFVVSDQGNIMNVEIMKSPDSSFSNAVLDVFNKMRDEEIVWVPGKKDQKNVNVQYTLPVKFKLN